MHILHLRPGRTCNNHFNYSVMLKTSYQKLARLFYAVFTIVHGHTLAITLSEKMYAQREEMKVSMSVEDFLYIISRKGLEGILQNSIH